MNQYIIRGGHPLFGEITISGAKNAAVGIIPAALLVDGICRIENIPQISDVTLLLNILEELGARIRVLNRHAVELDCHAIHSTHPSYEMARRIRASYYLIGALLGRFGEATVAMPGGCDFGVRPIDQHIKGFTAMGAEVKVESGFIQASAKGGRLTGTSIYLDVVSVGATMNIMMAAVLAKGTTIIENAAKEPHIVDLANFLNSMGADVKGAGTDSIKIRGVDRLAGGSFVNEYYIVSEAETRKLMNHPEVVGYEVYASLVTATSQMMYYLKEQKKITSANILSILRGALNYPLEESCYKEHIRVHDISFMSSERVFGENDEMSLDIKYCKLTMVPNSTLMIGDIIASGETLVQCLRYVTDYYRKQGAKLRNILLFTIGGTQGIEILEKLTKEIRTYWPDFEGFITVYYEGVFSCYEEGDKGVSGINRALIDFYWKGGIVAPEFRRQTLSMQNPLFEKCTIYDGGARRYEIHEHIEEVLEFWNGILARADKIDKQALLEEKLGHALPISYEDWLKDCHYEKLDAKLTRWLYQQERGFVESLKDVTLEEIAHQRIDEFTTTLKKYIL